MPEDFLCRDLQVRVQEPSPDFIKAGGNLKDAHGTIMVQRRDSNKGSQELKKQEPATQRQESAGVIVTIDADMGQIRAKYTHAHEGTDVLVVGLTETSFVPARSTDEFLNRFKLTVGSRTIPCVYTGLRFRDSQGIDNLILLTITEKESAQ